MGEREERRQNGGNEEMVAEGLSLLQYTCLGLDFYF